MLEPNVSAVLGLWGPKISVMAGDLQRCRTIMVVSTAGSTLVPASFLYKSITGSPSS
jgi:hypothetical protein